MFEKNVPRPDAPSIAYITEALQQRAAYVKCPEFDSSGNLTNTYARELFIYFSHSDKAAAAADEEVFRRFLEKDARERYSSRCATFHKSLNTHDPAVAAELQKVRARFPEVAEQPDEFLLHHPSLNGFNPPEAMRFSIHLNADSFERRYWAEIGLTIMPTTTEMFEIFRTHQLLHEELRDWAGGRQWISEEEADELNRFQPDLHARWAEFMVSGYTTDANDALFSPEDQFDLSYGEQQDLQQVVLLLKPHEVTNAIARSPAMHEAVGAAMLGLDIPFSSFSW